MSKVFCVSYDLHDPAANYSGLFKVLRGCAHWWRFLESTWLVVDDSYESLWSKLQPQLGPDDRLLIVGVTSEWAGALPKEAWDWIEKNLDKDPQADEQLVAVV